MAPSHKQLGRFSPLAVWLVLFFVLYTLAWDVTTSQAYEEHFCGLALMQGSRESMEDRALCMRPIAIPLPQTCPFESAPRQMPPSPSESGPNNKSSSNSEGTKRGEQDELEVRAFAVFDGHSGGEASQYAAAHIRKVLQVELRATFEHDRTVCNSVRSLLSKKALSPKGKQVLGRVSAALERALLRLDAEFLVAAKEAGIDAGTTACVAVLVADRWLQVANIGDSRATLCSAAPPSGCPSQCKAPAQRPPRKGKQVSTTCALELTTDHRFDRPEEIRRVEARGGLVLNIQGVPRLMGVSMLSRAIGDADLKAYGMIADPELSEWVDVGDPDARFLVIASDGVYEDIPGGQCVCDLIGRKGGRKKGARRQPAIPLGPASVAGGASGVGSLERNLVLTSKDDPGKKRQLGNLALGEAQSGTERKQSGDAQNKDGLSETEEQLEDQLPYKTEWPSKRDLSEREPSQLDEPLQNELPLEVHAGSGNQTGGAVKGVPAFGSACETERSAVGRPNTSRTAVPPSEIAERLRDVAFSSGSMDNIAVVVVDLQAIRDARKPAIRDGRKGEAAAEEKQEAQSPDAGKESPVESNGREADQTGVTEQRTRDGLGLSFQEDEVTAAVVKVSETPLAKAGGFKVYIGGQVVYGEGSEWCYQLVELVSGLRALPGPNPKTLLVPGDPFDEPVHIQQSISQEAIHIEQRNTNLPVHSQQRPAFEEPIHIEQDSQLSPLGFSDVQSALPQSPSPWGTTLELYHRHLIATVDTASLGGLAAFLDVVASVPIELGSATEVQPAWKGRPVEGTGGEAWMPAGVQREEGDNRYRYLLHDNFAKGSFGEVWRAVRMSDRTGSQKHRCRFSGSRTSHPDFELEEGEDCSGDAGTPFILKRLLVEKGGDIRLSGLREKFFGEMLMNASATWQHEQTTAHAAPSGPESGNAGKKGLLGGYTHIVRYMDSFEMHSGRELWLVFRDEGKSLQDWMYNSPSASGGQPGLGVVTPSAWWRWLRTDARGQQEMKSIMWQLLVALHTCHYHDITHRDVKPANLLLTTRPAHSTSDPSDWHQASNLSLRLIDFGSAWSPAVHHLYGTHGPSRLQETPEYSPPEALFAQEPWLPRRPDKATKYDTWSAGVLFLELLLGTPHVFQVSARTRALLDRHLAGCPDVTCKELAYTLRAFLELCIYPPAPLAPLFPRDNEGKESEAVKNRAEGETRPRGFVSWMNEWFTYALNLRGFVSKLARATDGMGDSTGQSSKKRSRSEQGKTGALARQCSEESFLNQLRARDPLGDEAAIDVWGLRLLRRLLQWNPEERISAHEALQHAYFRKGAPGGFKCGLCGLEFESHAQCVVHSSSLHEGEAAPHHHCS